MDEDNRTPGAITIVIPTWNEEGNLAPLIEDIARAMSDEDRVWRILIVDDDSQDGTRREAHGTRHTHPVRIMHRRARTRDLSRSVLDGMEAAPEGIVVVMDADGSHPPECIPELVQAIENGAQMALASRYCPAGSVAPGWTRHRSVLSRIATMLAAGLVRSTDPMSGFFALRTSAIPQREALNASGYKIGLEIMARGGIEPEEVPITFGPRRHGHSKLGPRQLVQYLLQIARLHIARLGYIGEGIGFGLVGASGVVVDFAAWSTLQAIGTDHRTARILSFVPALTWNWWGHRHLTFGDGRVQCRSATQWLRYTVTAGAGMGLNLATYLVMIEYAGESGTDRLAAYAAGIATGAAWNFEVSRRWVYRRWREP